MKRRSERISYKHVSILNVEKSRDGRRGLYRAFTTSGSSNNGNALSSIKYEADVFQDVRSVFIISNSDVTKLDAP